MLAIYNILVKLWIAPSSIKTVILLVLIVTSCYLLLRS